MQPMILHSCHSTPGMTTILVCSQGLHCLTYAAAGVGRVSAFERELLVLQARTEAIASRFSSAVERGLVALLASTDEYNVFFSTGSGIMMLTFALSQCCRLTVTVQQEVAK